MPPRVQLGLLVTFAILLVAVFALRIPERFLAPPDGSGVVAADEPAARSTYASDGFNAVMQSAVDAADRGDYETAVHLFLSIPAGGDPRSVAAQLNAGQLLLMELQQPTRGIKVLSELLLHFSEQTDARTLLAQYFDAFGRQFDADEQSRAVVQMGDTRLPQLVRLAEHRTGVGNSDLLHTLHEASPDDLNVRLGMALLDIQDGKLAAAEQTLRQVVTEDPQLWTAQAGLGTALSLQDKLTEYDAWRAALPAEAATSSEVWLARGLAADRRMQPEIAARCFIEAVRFDPDNLEANQGAARALTALNRAADAAHFEARAAKLIELAELVRNDPGMREQHDLDRAAKLTEELGRPWEARGWTYHLASNDRQNPEHQRRLKHFQMILVPVTVDKLRTEANPANHVDMAALPDK